MRYVKYKIEEILHIKEYDFLWTIVNKVDTKKENKKEKVKF